MLYKFFSCIFTKITGKKPLALVRRNDVQYLLSLSSDWRETIFSLAHSRLLSVIYRFAKCFPSIFATIEFSLPHIFRLIVAWRYWISAYHTLYSHTRSNVTSLSLTYCSMKLSRKAIKDKNYKRHFLFSFFVLFSFFFSTVNMIITAPAYFFWSAELFEGIDAATVACKTMLLSRFPNGFSRFSDIRKYPWAIDRPAMIQQLLDLRAPSASARDTTV